MIETKLVTAALNTPYLRTSVPTSIARQFGLKEGDKLLWRLEARKNNLVIVLEPKPKK